MCIRDSSPGASPRRVIDCSVKHDSDSLHEYGEFKPRLCWAVHEVYILEIAEDSNRKHWMKLVMALSGSEVRNKNFYVLICWNAFSP